MNEVSRSPRLYAEILRVPRGCPNPGGCGCTGACQELIEVVRAEEYWRVVGERDEARRARQAQDGRQAFVRGYVAGAHDVGDGTLADAAEIRANSEQFANAAYGARVARKTS